MILKSAASVVSPQQPANVKRLTELAPSASHEHRLPKKVPLVQLNEHLTCKLCKGYFIDATTIIECLHTFCRRCIVKYLESNKYCPVCDVQVHKTKPLLNIRPDKTLQDIVYKLVPRLFQDEMQRRKEFYAERPEAKPSGSEQKGESLYQYLFTPDEMLCISLKYDGAKDAATARYLRCPAAVSMSHLQKLIRAKYDLSEFHRVDILHNKDCLDPHLTLMDVAYIYSWRRKGPLALTYRIYENLKKLKTDPSRSQDTHENNNNNSSDSSEEGWKEVQLRISENGEMSVTGIQDCLSLLEENILKDDQQKAENEKLTQAESSIKEKQKPVNEQQPATKKIKLEVKDKEEKKSVIKHQQQLLERRERSSKDKADKICSVSVTTSQENKRETRAALQLRNQQESSNDKDTSDDTPLSQLAKSVNKEKFKESEEKFKGSEVNKEKFKEIEEKFKESEVNKEKFKETEDKTLNLKDTNRKRPGSAKVLEESKSVVDVKKAKLSELQSTLPSSVSLIEKPKSPQLQPPPVVLNHALGLQNLSNNHPLKKHSLLMSNNGNHKNSNSNSLPKFETSTSTSLTTISSSKESKNSNQGQIINLPSSVSYNPLTCTTTSSSGFTSSYAQFTNRVYTPPSPNYIPINVPNVNKVLQPRTSTSLPIPPIIPLHQHQQAKLGYNSTSKNLYQKLPLRPEAKFTNPEVINNRPAKMFKVRNNMPRYLGNPASGVKPMYSVQGSPEKDKDKEGIEKDKKEEKHESKTIREVPDLIPSRKQNQNKSEGECSITKVTTSTSPKKLTSTEIKKHYIVKIDPKTLKPISERAPEGSSLSTAVTTNNSSNSSSNLDKYTPSNDLKINTSSVSIFNPIKHQQSENRKSQSPHSPILQTKKLSASSSSSSTSSSSSMNLSSSSSSSMNLSPNSSLQHLQLQNLKHSSSSHPSLNSSSQFPNQKPLSFTSTNPFVPNLQAPTMSPNQYIYPQPGFPYDPMMAAFIAYHRAPFTYDFHKQMQQMQQQYPNIGGLMINQINQVERKSPQLERKSPHLERRSPQLGLAQSLQLEARNSQNLQAEGITLQNLLAEGRNAQNLHLEGRSSQNLQVEGRNLQNLQVEGRNLQNLQVEGRNQQNLQSEGRNQQNLHLERRSPQSLQFEAKIQLERRSPQQKSPQFERKSPQSQHHTQVEKKSSQQQSNEKRKNENIASLEKDKKNLEQTSSINWKKAETSSTGHFPQKKIKKVESLSKDTNNKDLTSCENSNTKEINEVKINNVKASTSTSVDSASNSSTSTSNLCSSKGESSSTSNSSSQQQQKATNGNYSSSNNHKESHIQSQTKEVVTVLDNKIIVESKFPKTQQQQSQQFLKETNERKVYSNSNSNCKTSSIGGKSLQNALDKLTKAKMSSENLEEQLKEKKDFDKNKEQNDLSQAKDESVLVNKTNENLVGINSNSEDLIKEKNDKDKDFVVGSDNKKEIIEPKPNENFNVTKSTETNEKNCKKLPEEIEEKTNDKDKHEVVVDINSEKQEIETKDNQKSLTNVENSGNNQEKLEIEICDEKNEEIVSVDLTDIEERQSDIEAEEKKSKFSEETKENQDNLHTISNNSTTSEKIEQEEEAIEITQSETGNFQNENTDEEIILENKNQIEEDEEEDPEVQVKQREEVIDISNENETETEIKTETEAKTKSESEIEMKMDLNNLGTNSNKTSTAIVIECDVNNDNDKDICIETRTVINKENENQNNETSSEENQSLTFQEKQQEEEEENLKEESSNDGVETKEEDKSNNDSSDKDNEETTSNINQKHS